MAIPRLSRFKKVGWSEIFSLNKILWTLVVSDILIISAFGFISPIFAVFLTEQIIGGSLVVVGIAEAIFLGVKSVLQIPIGMLIDRTEGEKIDFWFVVGGSLLMSLSVFLYLVATLPWHIYLIELLAGVASAMAYPAWTGLFTRNMEEGKESFAWSLASTTSELGSAATAAIGGYLADRLGFSPLFVIVGVVALLGTFILFAFYPEVTKAK